MQSRENRMSSSLTGGGDNEKTKNNPDRSSVYRIHSEPIQKKQTKTTTTKKYRMFTNELTSTSTSNSEGTLLQNIQRLNPGL